MFTNDPINSEIILSILGDIDKVYSLSKKQISLKGPANTVIEQTVSLVPEKKFPFVITKVSAKRGGSISFQLKEVMDGDVLRYELTVKNIQKEAGRYFDTIYLETDNDDQPEIKITVVGNIQQPAG